MYRNAVLGAVLVCLLAGQSMAQDSLAVDLYGRGVHAYFAGQYEQSLKLLSESLEAEKGDPRAHYFRGLAYASMGDKEKSVAEYKAGALVELANTERPFNIGRALQRVQGYTRLEIEKHRQEARVAAARLALAKREARYRDLKAAEKDVLVNPDRPAPPAPMSDEAPADASDPFTDSPAPAAGVAPPVNNTPPPAPEVPDPFSNPGTPEPTTPADDATPAPSTDTTPADPFAKPADPFATPPAGDDKPADPPAGDTAADAAPADTTAADTGAKPKGASSLFKALFKAATPTIPNLPQGVPGIPGVGGGGPPAGADPFSNPPAGADPFSNPPAGNDPFKNGGDGAPAPPAGGDSDPFKDDPAGGDDPFKNNTPTGDDPFKNSGAAGDDPFKM